MSLLIDIRIPEWMTEEALRDKLQPLLPGVTIHCGAPSALMPDVTVVAVVGLDPAILPYLPNLQLVQKLGAGVDAILDVGALGEHVRVARLAPDAPAHEIAEYCLAYVLRFQRNMAAHERAAAEGSWQALAPRRAARTTVGVLGLGHIGGYTARLFAKVGFRTIGWSRSAKSIDNVDCRHGSAGLASLLGEADYVASILPSTPETRGLFDAAKLGWMRPGAVFINAGRGDLIDDDALLKALDAGRPGHAVLDVFRHEPLDPDHPFWRHPQVTVTPHVSGWSLDDCEGDIAENYRRLSAGKPLLHEIDRRKGY